MHKTRLGACFIFSLNLISEVKQTGTKLKITSIVSPLCIVILCVLSTELGPLCSVGLTSQKKFCIGLQPELLIWNACYIVSVKIKSIIGLLGNFFIGSGKAFTLHTTRKKIKVSRTVL